MISSTGLVACVHGNLPVQCCSRAIPGSLSVALFLYLTAAMDANVPIKDAFKVADDVLRQGVKGISEIITVSPLCIHQEHCICL